ncbi:MAG TPA: hypothetical protein VHG32_09765 [Thermoanaerobaculia bacterium]|jgi:hypothetical protein|nr:hypothetical protein [Thermoanaerobaculia bacterium]
MFGSRFFWRSVSTLVEVSKVAISCGIAEHQVRLADEHGKIIAAVLLGVLSDLGIAPQEQEVRIAVRRHLLLVSGEPV